MKHATEGIEEISKSVDALIVIENEKLNINYAELPLSEAFKKVDEVLASAAISIVEIIKNNFKPIKKYNIGKIDWSETVLENF